MSDVQQYVPDEAKNFRTGGDSDLGFDESKKQSDYTHIEYVPEGFGQKPDVFKLKHLLEIDAENTIVMVGDSKNRTGLPLSYSEVPHLEVPVPSYFDRSVMTNGKVKAIKEGERTVAFATNHEKAMLFLGKHAEGQS